MRSKSIRWKVTLNRPFVAHTNVAFHRPLFHALPVIRKAFSPARHLNFAFIGITVAQRNGNLTAGDDIPQSFCSDSVILDERGNRDMSILGFRYP